MKSNYPEIEALLTAAQAATEAGVTAEVRTEFLGKGGKVQELMRSTASKPEGERPAFSKAVQAAKAQIEELLKPKQVAEQSISVDMTVPAHTERYGSIHPISAMIEEMVGIFADLSFEVVEGAEIVEDTDNFENLNMGADHPARDGHDSFYLDDKFLLRTQTTAVQVLEMRKRFKANQLPIRVVVPGKTFRRESDQTHSAMFHQIDAVVVDTNSTFADLKGTLDYFAKRLFGDSVETRFRPHHFPFTEPSAEMDIRWKGTSTIEGKHTRWLEMGGCGMIHPDVLRRAGINPRIYRGWAFGMSIERPIMVRNHVPDLRLLYANSVPTLEQFSRFSWISPTPGSKITLKRVPHLKN